MNETQAESIIPPPNPWLALTEIHRAVAEVISLKFSHKALAKAPDGDGHPVMVLPGFMGDDNYNASFRRFLGKQNYEAHGWGLGRNLGPRNGVIDALEQRITELYESYGGPISLVGHSLGGIYARELARKMPGCIRQVISLGSPFGEGRHTGSYPAKLFTALNPSDELPIDEAVIGEAPPVPTTAVYTHGDGIVNWLTAVQSDGHDQTQNIRVRGSHCGLTLNPTVWFLVAERLSQNVGEWQPFERESWSKLLYPASKASTRH